MKTPKQGESRGIENLGLLLASTVVAYCGAIFFLLIPPVLFFTQKVSFSISPLTTDKHLIERSTVNAWKLVVMGDPDYYMFTSLEESHLFDVHRLIRNFFLIGLIAFAIFIIRRRRIRDIPRQTYKLFILLLLFCTLFAVAIFPLFFDSFHQIFFSQGNYSFPSNSLLIQTFPILFWIINFVLMQLLVITFFLFQLHRAPDRKF
jgi:hypothetical protein